MQKPPPSDDQPRSQPAAEPCEPQLQGEALADRLAASHLHFDPKQTIYNAGDEPDSVYFIRRGLVKLLSHLPNGNSRIVRLHYAPSWLGLGRVLGEPCEHTAIAIDRVEIRRISIDDMLRLRSSSPDTYIQLLEHWFEYLQRADRWITEFSTGSIRSRLARLLNYLGELENGNDELRLLTCEELAEILGTTAESVSRQLAELKRNDVLSPGQDDQHYRYDEDKIGEFADSQ